MCPVLLNKYYFSAQNKFYCGAILICASTQCGKLIYLRVHRTTAVQLESEWSEQGSIPNGWRDSKTWKRRVSMLSLLSCHWNKIHNFNEFACSGNDLVANRIAKIQASLIAWISCVMSWCLCALRMVHLASSRDDGCLP